MATQDDIDVVLSGSEIEPNGVYDFRLRQAHTEDFPKFRGLAGQATINPDDKNRLSIWKGTNLGEKEDVPFISDLQEATLDVNFKSIKQSYVKDTVEGPEYIIDPDRSNKFFLNVNHAQVNFKIKEGFTSTSNVEVTLVLTNILDNIEYTFDTSIKWLGGDIKLDSSITSSNILCLSYKGDSWVAYALDASINDRQKFSILDEAITSNARLLGWFLPSGSPNGEVSDKYATITSNPNLTDEDLKNVARVSSAIYDVIDVSKSLEDIHRIEDYVDDIRAVAKDIKAVVDVAPHIYTLAWINSHLSLFEFINEHEETLTSIYDHMLQITNVDAHIASIVSVHDNMETITSLNGIKDFVVTAANIKDAITNVSNNSTSVTTVSNNIEAVKTVVGNLPNITTTSTNIEAVNKVGVGMDTVNEVASKLPQMINILNNLDNIKELGNYINKGLLLRTVATDSLTDSYESSDVNKIYILPKAMFDSIEG